MRHTSQTSRAAQTGFLVSAPADVTLAKQRVEQGTAQRADIVIHAVDEALQHMNPNYASVWRAAHGWGVKQQNRNAIAKQRNKSHAGIGHAYWRAHAIVAEAVAQALWYHDPANTLDQEHIEEYESQITHWTGEAHRYTNRNGTQKAVRLPADNTTPTDNTPEDWEAFHQQNAHNGTFDPTTLLRPALDGANTGHHRRKQ